MDYYFHQLTELGLDEYFTTLIESGFDTWDKLATITEGELERLGFKRGHRRLLQRRIADLQGHPRGQPLPRQSSSRSPAAATVASPPDRTGSATATPSTTGSGSNSNGLEGEIILPSIEGNDPSAPLPNPSVGSGRRAP